VANNRRENCGSPACHAKPTQDCWFGYPRCNYHITHMPMRGTIYSSTLKYIRVRKDTIHVCIIRRTCFCTLELEPIGTDWMILLGQYDSQLRPRKSPTAPDLVTVCDPHYMAGYLHLKIQSKWWSIRWQWKDLAGLQPLLDRIMSRICLLNDKFPCTEQIFFLSLYTFPQGEPYTEQIFFFESIRLFPWRET